MRDKFKSKQQNKRCVKAFLALLFMLVIFAAVLVLVVTLNKKDDTETTGG